MKSNLVLPLARACLLPADALRAGDAGGPVAEIVRFRLVAGVSDAAFLEATRAMQPVVEATPGYVSRRLSKNGDGSWTDYVVWSHLDLALTAAETVFADPSTATFGAAIDAKSIDMRHEPILLQME